MLGEHREAEGAEGVGGEVYDDELGRSEQPAEPPITSRGASQGPNARTASHARMLASEVWGFRATSWDGLLASLHDRLVELRFNTL